MNPSDILRLSRSFFTLLTAACQSPDEWQRYDLPLLYWDCLTPSSRLIRPPENPNALIPTGNHFLIFFYNLLSNDLLIVASTLTENYRSFLGNQIFTPFMSVYVAQVSRDSVRGYWLWGAAVCESLQCHSSTASAVPRGWPCDSLLLSTSLSIVLHYLSVDKYSVGAWFQYGFKTYFFHSHIISMQEPLWGMSVLGERKKRKIIKNNPCSHRRSQISVLKALMLQNVSSVDRSSKKHTHTPDQSEASICCGPAGHRGLQASKSSF